MMMEEVVRRIVRDRRDGRRERKSVLKGWLVVMLAAMRMKRLIGMGSDILRCVLGYNDTNVDRWEDYLYLLFVT